MITEFAKLTGISELDILGKSRKRNISDTRLMYRYILSINGYSCREIAKLCGCNHTVVVNGKRRVRELIETGDKEMIRLYEIAKSVKYTKININTKEKSYETRN